MNWYGLLFVAIGLFSATAAACDWEWFMTHYKARFFVSIFGRTGARIFYVLIGLGFVVLGVLFMLGIIADRH
ncbi:MAG: immunity 17 family protein [Planctomycetia bacterium]|nr:immunity 17 family protein [Planctomycetia bacterium]